MTDWWNRLARRDFADIAGAELIGTVPVTESLLNSIAQRRNLTQLRIRINARNRLRVSWQLLEEKTESGGFWNRLYVRSRRLVNEAAGTLLQADIILNEQVDFGAGKLRFAVDFPAVLMKIIQTAAGRIDLNAWLHISPGGGYVDLDRAPFGRRYREIAPLIAFLGFASEPGTLVIRFHIRVAAHSQGVTNGRHHSTDHR